MAKSVGFGISIVPAVYEYQVFKPGTVYSGEFTVANNTDSEITLRVEKFDVSQEQNGATSLKERGDPNFSLSPWISVCCKDFVLKPGEKRKVTYKIAVPVDPLPGGKYGAIVLVAAGQNTKNRGVSLREGIAHVIIGRVAGKTDLTSQIESISVIPKVNFRWPWQKTSFSLKVINNGNLHERIKGNIFIYRGVPTRTKAVISVNPSNTLVLPKSSRVYTYQLPSDPIISLNKQGLKLSWRGFYLGKYHALVRVKHHVNNRVVTFEKDVSFWILPWWIIFIILVLLVGFMLKLHHGVRNKS